jgi:hypothetical protein
MSVAEFDKFFRNEVNETVALAKQAGLKQQ